MNELTSRMLEQEWPASGSIHTIEFERKPVLDDISIVIPTLGRAILEQSLFWILVGSAWPGRLIVVEQGANPDVAAWLRRVQELGVRVKHILSSQRGRSAGINRGLEQLDTRFVAITDDELRTIAESRRVAQLLGGPRLRGRSCHGDMHDALGIDVDDEEREDRPEPEVVRLKEVAGPDGVVS